MCDAPRLASAPEMAALLAMRVSTFRDLARRRRFPAYRIGRAVRFDPAEIYALLRQEGGD